MTVAAMQVAEKMVRAALSAQPAERHELAENQVFRSKTRGLKTRMQKQVNGVIDGLSRWVAPRSAMPDDEIVERFSDFRSWQSFAQGNPAIFDPDRISRIVEHGKKHGLHSDYFGKIGPDQVAIHGPNYREEFHGGGFNPRQRALLDLVSQYTGFSNPHEVRIYGHEGLTNFALTLRGRYVRFLGSEYAGTSEARQRLFPIPVVDITQSGFPDASFHLILSGDVFEHVPDVPAALRDSARILCPGGRLLATFPFNYGGQETIPKAALQNGEVVFLAAPEYHGNPADPAAGSLVFQIPGWDILSMARDAGFARAEMLFWSSKTRGFVGAEIGGIFVLEALR